MTTERAIELLHRISDSQFDGIHGDERREALEMAVRALVEPNIGQKTIDCIIKRLNDEDRTTGDLISRQQALDAIKYAELGCEYEAIEELPSAQPQWIPCSERLPEANGRYLATRGLNACGAMWNRVYIINYSDLMGLKPERIWWDGNVGKSDFERFDDVIAWMPLSKPYGGENE